MQVFHLKSHGKLIICKENEQLNYQIHWLSSDIPDANTVSDWADIASSQSRGWQKLSARSKKRKWSSLRAFLDWLKKEEGIDIPVITPSSPKTPQNIPHFLSVDECMTVAQFLLKKIDHTEALRQQTLLFFLMYGAGLRVSEACRLQWENINLEKRQLLFRGKGNKERVVVAPRFVCKILEEYGSHETPSIWGEKPIPERTAYERIRKLGIQAGLYRPLNPHALRHSYASQLLTSGSDLRVLQQLLGHESLSATELYTHLDIDHLARSMENYHPLGSKK